MCDQHDHEHLSDHAHEEEHGITRRRLLGAGLGFTAGLVIAHRLPLAPARAATASAFTSVFTNSAGERTIRLAAHIHGSGSEGTASHDAHFAQAAGLGFDAICPTDHDWRIVYRNYRRDYHFSGLAEAGLDGGTWNLGIARLGSVTSGSVAEITPLSCPLDPAPDGQKGTLHLLARSTTAAQAGYTVTVNSNNATQNYKGSVQGRAPTIAVLPLHGGASAWLGVQFSLSRDARNGLKSILYRLRTDLVSRRVAVAGAKATIDVPVTAGQWNTVEFDLLADVTACWPAIVARDTAFYNVQLLARATNKTSVEGHFAYLHILEDPAYDGLSAYQSVVEAVAANYPGVLPLYGLEHSVDQHLGQYGGEPFIYPYPESTLVHPLLGDAVAIDQVRQIQAHGGVATANHPWGTDQTITQANRAARLAQQKQRFLATRAYGADGVEVYEARGGMDLAGHLSLLWMLWSNGIFISPIGVSDDHSGTSWVTQKNRFYMIPWGLQVSEASIRAAIRSGRISIGKLGDFQGALDFTLDGQVRMGQVAVNPDAVTRAIVVEAFGLPAGAVVEVMQGVVSYAGAGTPDPVVAASLSAEQLATGRGAAVTLSTGEGAHVSLVARDSAGAVIAFTGAAWTLRTPPPAGFPAIPAQRLALA